MLRSALLVVWASAVLVSPPCFAQDAREVLVTAKYAGACGILTGILDFQRTTKMAGGDEFVARYWNTEAARLGMTVKEMVARCAQSVSLYDALWKAAELPNK